jgi:hypothetical protein
MTASRLATVLFVDTSILDEILGVPGWTQDREAVAAEFSRRSEAGEQLVIPISAIIETGNHIFQCTGDRRAAAGRFVTLLTQLTAGSAPWRVNVTTWNVALLSQLLAGAHTGCDLHDLLSDKLLGGGDLAILVEAGRLEATTFGLSIDLWTMDEKFAAHWPFGRTIVHRSTGRKR